MKYPIWTGFALSSVLLAALLSAGCDTVSHGSSAEAKQSTSPASGSAADGQPTDDPASADTGEENSDAPAGDQIAAAADATAENVTAEPMPRPVRGDDGKVVEISFDDVNLRMQADMVFRPWLVSDRVKDLEGRRVKITGVVYPDNKRKGLTEFVLLKNIQCKFGPGGMADHLAIVKLKDGVKFDYAGDQPVSVEGVLRLNPFQGIDGNTWSIYDLEAADNVTVLRR